MGLFVMSTFAVLGIMRVLAFLALCVAAIAAVPSNPQRIVGGSVTTIDQYPSMVALLYTMNTVSFIQGCGGTLLNNRAILTAAHCTLHDSVSRWRIRVGSTNANSGGVVHILDRIINHPNYNHHTFDNDIGVVHTAGNIAYNENVRPAPIAGSNYNLADNQVVWATGWGKTSQGGYPSEQLRHVQIWTVNHDTCRYRFASVGDTITDNMLCAGWLDVGGRDQCPGDSGGPLYHNGVVVGVCSWGRGCAQAYFPGVNARVSRFTSWIQTNA